MKKINAFIVGAQKAGTTSLYNWLGQHPDVNAPYRSKDYHFFSNDDLYKKGVGNFHSIHKIDRKKIQLHAGANYLYNYRIASRRIYNYNPDAKLIICLRDPVDRAISAYRYFVRTLREKHQSFENALDQEKDGKILGIKKNNYTYIEHGRYLIQIKGYLKHFSRKDCKILIFERLVDEEQSQEVMNELSTFLDIPKYSYDFYHHNKSGVPKSIFLNKLLRDDNLLKKSLKFIPKSFRLLVSKKVEELNTSKKDIDLTINEEVIQQLVNEFREEVDLLSDFLDEDLSGYWKV